MLLAYIHGSMKNYYWCLYLNQWVNITCVYVWIHEELLFLSILESMSKYYLCIYIYKEELLFVFILESLSKYCLCIYMNPWGIIIRVYTWVNE